METVGASRETGTLFVGQKQLKFFQIDSVNFKSKAVVSGYAANMIKWFSDNEGN